MQKLTDLLFNRCMYVWCGCVHMYVVCTVCACVCVCARSVYMCGLCVYIGMCARVKLIVCTPRKWQICIYFTKNDN